MGVFFATTPARAQLTWKEGELIIPHLLHRGFLCHNSSVGSANVEGG